MKISIVISMIIIFFVPMACTNVDVSNESKYNYGYKVDHIYKTKDYLLILPNTFNLTKVRNVDKPYINNKKYFLGKVVIGTKFKIIKLIYHPKRFSGTIDSRAVILDGKFKGQIVSANLLVKRGEDGRHAYPDEDIVEDLGIEKTDK